MSSTLLSYLEKISCEDISECSQSMPQWTIGEMKTCARHMEDANHIEIWNPELFYINVVEISGNDNTPPDTKKSSYEPWY